MSIDERWIKVSKVPLDKLKPIGFGNLKGKSDINPQWRIKAMTEVYGLCGFGWRYEVDEVTYRQGSKGKEVVFVKISLFIKDSSTNEWSMPIIGVGGDMVIDENKNGIHENDEALKMATTDALGNAMKYIGVASEIYEGNFDGSKYKESKEATQENPKQNTNQPIKFSAVKRLSNEILKFSNQKEIAAEIYKIYGVTTLKDLPESSAESAIISVESISQKLLKGEWNECK